MSCLGVLFSLDEAEVEKLKKISTNDNRLDYLQEEIEETYFEKYPQRLAELDKSWDALHRSLTNGYLEWENGEFPENHIILGGEMLYQEDDYIMILKSPDQVREIAKTIDTITREKLKEGYFRIPAEDYVELTEEDFEYTWSWFNASKEFWKLASKENRYVLFTADQ